jgi:hypothetical protein
MGAGRNIFSVVLVCFAIICLLCTTDAFKPRLNSGLMQRRASTHALQMKEGGIWWKSAIASLGILSTSFAGAPNAAFAADTVKVRQ